MGWLITLGILILLAILPLGVCLRYDVEGPLARVMVGPVKLTVYPAPTKMKKAEKKSSKASKQPEAPAESLPQPPKPPQNKTSKGEKKGGSLTDFIPLVKLGIRLLGDFRRKLRVRDLQVKLVLAGDDPCDLAVNYGRTWAAVSNFMPRLESWFVIQKRNVEIACDFTASETLVTAYLELTITLGRLISLVLVYALRAIIEYLNIQKKRKGGAVT